MLMHYRTVKREGAAEIVIKKSRFIGYAKPVVSEAEAIAFIEEIKKQHRMANHNCSAYMLGERDEIQKASDDGEPSGTAGKPILEVIKNQGLKNVAVVVTRYFGGIMLGAGGLVRAYTDGAVAGLAAAEQVYKVLHRDVRVAIDYTWHGKVDNELRGFGTLLGETEFTDKVTLRCLPLEQEAGAFIAWMTDLTQGQAEITEGEQLYVEHMELPEPKAYK
ncbi:YigZ family protein [Paenibacillus sp. YYML68]|uniref:YigZ family protein n=1 Tax=Paenibacillus sp. YYML68 TaxID=2909250 RepID=UPI0024931158|nr:YigZ family protein [Paenibacillus sp. YYML68]